MKKILAVCLKKLMPLVCLVCMLSGCAEIASAVIEGTVYLVGEAVGAGVDAAVDAAKDAKEMREFARQRSANPLDSPVEGRLKRRTSTLTGGIPVDVSPYLVHEKSFTVTENGIQQSISKIKFTDFSPSYLFYGIDEQDVVLAFKANKQSYQMNVTAANYNVKQIKKDTREFAARRLGLKPTNLLNFEVQLLNPRRYGDSKFSFTFDNVFIQDSEPCHYQFDVQVEYQKTEVKKGGEQSEEHFAVFDKVYHSWLMSEAAAAFEVQAAIWADARADGFKETPLPIINVVKAVKVPQADAVRAWAKRKAKERADNFSKRGDGPFTNSAEERLTRRTSTLAGGLLVDVSPYLLHENSFAVTQNGIQHYNSTLEFAEGPLGSLFEFDVALTFEANGQNCQMNAAAAVCGSSQTNAQNRVKEYMRQYAAGRLGLEPKTLKNYKVQFLKTRKCKSEIGFNGFENVIVHNIEPGYFQFDAEVEYQKKKTSFMGFDTKLTPKNFDIFNNVYRSDFMSKEAAAIDVQAAIWKDARKKGFKETPLPVINFVKVAKIKL